MPTSSPPASSFLATRVVHVAAPSRLLRFSAFFANGWQKPIPSVIVVAPDTADDAAAVLVDEVVQANHNRQVLNRSGDRLGWASSGLVLAAVVTFFVAFAFPSATNIILVAAGAFVVAGVVVGIMNGLEYRRVLTLLNAPRILSDDHDVLRRIDLLPGADAIAPARFDVPVILTAALALPDRDQKAVHALLWEYAGLLEEEARVLDEADEDDIVATMEELIPKQHLVEEQLNLRLGRSTTH
ncbi:hypothetical protein [Isoptericola haloaureus]|uniref:Uncharacterized protein n=1 Tax=Isoptericola haloaureus TaxID=1542902 RepID=A0ABU7Z5G4_9MICO